MVNNYGTVPSGGAGVLISGTTKDVGSINDIVWCGECLREVEPAFVFLGSGKMLKCCDGHIEGYLPFSACNCQDYMRDYIHSGGLGLGSPHYCSHVG